MPYLTLWDKMGDKISQNLAFLKADSHKFFKSHIILRPSKNKFYKEIIINHTLLCSSQVSYIYLKAFWLFWGSFKVIFVKTSHNFIKSDSLEILLNLTNISPQFMACMHSSGPQTYIDLEMRKIFQKCILLFYNVVLKVADKALEYCKLGSFHKNFIFENSIKRHICEA